MPLLAYAHKASEIVNTDRTIRIGDNRIPKHFLSKERTCAKKEYILLVKLSFPKKGLYA